MKEELIAALKAAGFTYNENYEQPEFDGPWIVFFRDSDEAFIVGSISYDGSYLNVVMDPENLLAEWVFSDLEPIDDFIEDFKVKFEEFWQYVNR